MASSPITADYGEGGTDCLYTACTCLWTAKGAGTYRGYQSDAPCRDIVTARDQGAALTGLQGGAGPDTRGVGRHGADSRMRDSVEWHAGWCGECREM